MEIWIPQMTRSGWHGELLQKVGESVNCCTSKILSLNPKHLKPGMVAHAVILKLEGQRQADPWSSLATSCSSQGAEEGA